MFGPFDKMFDFDDNGELDVGEKAMQFQFIDDMINEDQNEDELSDDEEVEEALGLAGYDMSDLEDMDEDELADALDEAGLDMDDLDW